jgi:hypothetical protein
LIVSGLKNPGFLALAAIRAFQPVEVAKVPSLAACRARVGFVLRAESRKRRGRSGASCLGGKLSLQVCAKPRLQAEITAIDEMIEDLKSREAKQT